MRIKLLVVLFLLVSASVLGCMVKNQTIKVMCFNVRYDNEGDGEFAWSKRKGAVVMMLLDEKPQIIGMQEVLKGQLDYLGNNLKEYGYIGVGRDDGKEAGEFSPIFYDRESLKLVKDGHFWLSETPNEPSRGWDAACKRVATWGVFEDIKTKKQFICINTHFDHVGKLAREKSGQQMLDSLKTLASGLPSIIMGDFNAPIEDISLRPLVQSAKSVRSWNPDFEKQPKYTYAGFPPSTQKALIDHIFVQVFEPEDYKVIQKTYGVKQLSDHLPVSCKLSF